MPPGSRGSYLSSCVAQERTGLRAARSGSAKTRVRAMSRPMMMSRVLVFIAARCLWCQPWHKHESPR